MQWLGWFWVPHELGNLHTLRCTPTNSWGHHCVESDWSCWWPQLQVVEGVFSDEDIDMSLDPWAAEWCLERRISSQIKQSPMKVAESKSCAIHSVAWMWLFDAPSGQNNMEIWKFLALTLSSRIYQNSIGTSGELIHYDWWSPYGWWLRSSCFLRESRLITMFWCLTFIVLLVKVS